MLPLVLQNEGVSNYMVMINNTSIYIYGHNTSFLSSINVVFEYHIKIEKVMILNMRPSF